MKKPGIYFQEKASATDICNISVKTGIYFVFSFFLLFSFFSCQVDTPAIYEELKEKPVIYPDYQEIVIPYNIAPLNFMIREEGTDYITRISGERGEDLLIRGKKVNLKTKDWHTLLEHNRGAHLFIEIFLKKNQHWYKYPVIRNRIAEEPIDEYISYRLIAPLYVTFKEMSIRQRNITDFDERVIYSNKAVAGKNEQQCINCHAYQNYKTGNMQFHARQVHPGTVIVTDGVPEKVNIRTQNLISGGVYPAWHPTEKLIAYSVNNTGQLFHAKESQKVEVFDLESDLILLDVKTKEIFVIQDDPDSFETFPAWSPDGSFLYYSSAWYKTSGKAPRLTEIGTNYQSLFYDLIRLPFNKQNRTFGKPDTVFKASEIAKSATLPRISPDGKYLLFTLADYGTFHIWHKSSDLMLLDLETKKLDSLEIINSPDVESYHSWSSNGRWILFSSRREDGSYTRLYISYFDKEGNAYKPFILPQKDPEFYGQLFKSYNIPEFMSEPVTLSARDFANILKGNSIQATLKDNYLQGKTAAENENFY